MKGIVHISRRDGPRQNADRSLISKERRFQEGSGAGAQETREGRHDGNWKLENDLVQILITLSLQNNCLIRPLVSFLSARLHTASLEN